MSTTMSTTEVSVERANLLQMLAHQRHFLRLTVRGITDEQAARRRLQEHGVTSARGAG